MHRFLVVVGCVAVAACGSGGSDELLGGSPRENVPLPGSSGTSGDSSAPESSTTTSGGTSGTSGDAGGTDAGTDTGTNVSVNAFTDAPAYTAKLGGNARKNDHPFPNGNPAKQNCLESQCHGPGGEGPLFLTGGTVFKDVAGTMPAPSVEVRLRDATGKAISTYTDNDGNFYAKGTLAFPVLTGVRDGQTVRLMSGAIANGGCNAATCHAGAQGPIHVP